MYPLAIIAVINTSLILHLLTTFLVFIKDLSSIRNSNPSSPLIHALFKASKLSGKRKFWFVFENKLMLYERRVYWLNYLSGLSTLSGLLGTVIGIYISFQNMKISGTASAEVFADGCKNPAANRIQ